MKYLKKLDLVIFGLIILFVKIKYRIPCVASNFTNRNIAFHTISSKLEKTLFYVRTDLQLPVYLLIFGTLLNLEKKSDKIIVFCVEPSSPVCVARFHRDISANLIWICARHRQRKLSAKQAMVLL
jgi:hypothetical protein